MSEKKRVTAATLLRAKQRGEKTVWLTAYDAASARIAEQAGVDVLLVGDSLGMVCLGLDSTIPVTLDMMIHHTAAVVRGRENSWVVCDLPFGTYQKSPEQAFDTCTHVLQKTGCDAVKLEGGQPMAGTIQFLADRGVAVVGHIGLTPQSVKKFGSYRKRGSNEIERKAIIEDALAVEAAGAVAVVLECIPESLATEVTTSLSIPTVGIGAGAGCNAQVLVWHDLLGMSARNPSFAPAYERVRERMVSAIGNWAEDVRLGRFPADKS
jgi:3-methyl-2-oxobutanoate hydroxymethyltransferase